MHEGAVIREIASHNSGTIGTINVVVNQQVQQIKVVEKYPDGSIGRDARRRNYVRYLADRFYHFRQGEADFGADPAAHAVAMKELYPRLNGAIKRKFGAYPNCLPLEKFEAVAEYLKIRIDYTSLAKQQAAAGQARWMTFEEHQALGD